MASVLPKPWTVDEFLAWEREQAERYEFVDGVVRMMTGGTLAHTAECVQDDRIPRQATDSLGAYRPVGLHEAGPCSPTPVGSARPAHPPGPGPSSSSATLKHTLIKGNLFYALHSKLSKPWHAFVSGPKVLTATASLYPDVVVTCAPVVMADDTVSEPRLIAEVLSRSTAQHDRGTKWLSGCPGERILRQASDVHGAYRPVGLHEASPCSPTSVGSARPASPSSSTLTLSSLGQQLPSLAHYLLVWQDVRRVELFSRRGDGWELAIVEAPALLRLEALGIEVEVGQLYEGLEV